MKLNQNGQFSDEYEEYNEGSDSWENFYNDDDKNIYSLSLQDLMKNMPWSAIKNITNGTCDVVKDLGSWPGYVFKVKDCYSKQYPNGCKKVYLEPPILDYLYDKIKSLSEIPQFGFDVTQQLMSFCNLNYKDLFYISSSNISHTANDENITTFTGATDSYYSLNYTPVDESDDPALKEVGESFICTESLYYVLPFAVFIAVCFLGYFLNKQNTKFKEIKQDLECNVKPSEKDLKVAQNSSIDNKYCGNTSLLDSVKGCFGQGQGDYDKLLGSTNSLNPHSVEEV